MDKYCFLLLAGLLLGAGASAQAVKTIPAAEAAKHIGDSVEKKVCVTGRLEEYKGKPQIVVHRSSHLKEE